jgi:oxygen-independent coproporphyrinogen-3 oxidase
MYDSLTAPVIDLLSRYDRPGPRYTSYPTAVEFHSGVNEAVYRERLAQADRASADPLSIYVHLPFCEARCSYCGCHVVITKHRDVEARYLDYLEREIDLVAAALPNRRQVSQMHWGGGTPTYSSPADLKRMAGWMRRHFSFTPDAEIGIEVDPRVTSAEQLAVLREQGFNRLSLGVQDFAPEVQQAVNRVQSYEITRDIIEAGRRLGYSSVNVDLIYGLPYQTIEGFSRTLEQVLTLQPDRVAVYSFAFVPWIRAHMKHLPAEALPGPTLKLELLARTIDAFVGAGYRQIGMDHFARPDDELGRAIDNRSLHRNFMGYTVQSARDMIAFGVSGIGDVQGAFIQNVKKLSEYYTALEAGRLPIDRGYALDADDLIRRRVITQLMCNNRLSFAEIERAFDISFAQYFAAELAELTGAGSAATDGLVQVTDTGIEVTATGRLFIRNVCMVFDRYLRARTAEARPVFSRTV